MAQRITICICEDDALYQRSLQLWLAQEFQVEFSRSGDELLEQVERLSPDLILLDLNLPAGLSGFAVLDRLRRGWPELPVIIHSGMVDHSSVVRAMRLGATDYIPKDGDGEVVRNRIRQLSTQRCRTGLPKQSQEMIGDSTEILELRSTIRRIKNFPGNVIILGETGVGKELVARALRCDKAPFVTVDAATIAQSTAESLLFGHERGAFTGADRARAGLFEAAHGGVLYFDEIANMSQEVQAKLLRALQEKEVVRLGASEVRKLSFRVICATNRDLQLLSRSGDFRSDLYERLNVFALRVPSLSQRRGDIPRLIAHFLAMYTNSQAPSVAADAMAALCAYDWPGNIRELGNVVQYMLAMSEAAPIEMEHLPAKITSPMVCDATDCGNDEGGYYDRLRTFERSMLTREYDLARGNVARMARKLRIDRSNLHRKLIEHEIHVVSAKLTS